MVGLRRGRRRRSKTRKKTCQKTLCRKGKPTSQRKKKVPIKNRKKCLLCFCLCYCLWCVCVCVIDSNAMFLALPGFAPCGFQSN